MVNRRTFLGAVAAGTVGYLAGTGTSGTARAAETGYGHAGYGDLGYGHAEGTVIGTPTPTPTPTRTPLPEFFPIQIDRMETIRADSGEIIGIRVCDELSEKEVCHTYE